MSSSTFPDVHEAPPSTLPMASSLIKPFAVFARQLAVLAPLSYAVANLGAPS